MIPGISVILPIKSVVSYCVMWVKNVFISLSNAYFFIASLYHIAFDQLQISIFSTE